MMHQGLFVILLSLFVSVQSQYAYDCRRLDDCKNNGTCNTGDCNCTGTFGNYDCGVNTALTQCNLTCENGGTCNTVGFNETCLCPYGYHGTLCELTNVNIICSGDKAEFVLSFPSAFEGEVSLVNGDSAIDKGNCTVTQTVDGSYTNYSIAIDISTNQDDVNTSCKVANLQTIGNSTTGEIYRVSLLVTYFLGITTTLDEVYHGNCSHETQTFLDQGFSNVAVDNNNLTANEFADAYSPVSLAVVDSGDAPLTSDSKLYVGSIFKLVAHLTDTLAYSTVRLERCETNNTLDGDAVRKFLILDKGCPTQQSKRLTTGQSIGTYGPGIVDFPAAKLSIEAFKFSNSDKMGIVCTAAICKANDTTCAIPPDCEAVRKSVTAPPTDAAPPADAKATTEAAATTTAAVQGGRKRRAADNVNSDVEDKETLSTVITILGPNDVSDRSKSSSEMEQPLATVENCFTHSEILAVVTVLSGIVCILLIACLVLACLLIKRKAKSVEFESMPAPPSDRFRIPRAHVNDAFTLREV